MSKKDYDRKRRLYEMAREARRIREGKDSRRLKGYLYEKETIADMKSQEERVSRRLDRERAEKRLERAKKEIREEGKLSGKKKNVTTSDYAGTNERIRERFDRIKSSEKPRRLRRTKQKSGKEGFKHLVDGIPSKSGRLLRKGLKMAGPIGAVLTIPDMIEPVGAGSDRIPPSALGKGDPKRYRKRLRRMK